MIEQYTVERIHPHKQFAVWAMTGNRIYPVCYIQKPKWMSESDYEKVAKCIRFDAPKNILEHNQ